MTDQELNEKLARAMGWDFIQKSSEMAYSGEGEWYTPDGQSYGDEPPGFCAEEERRPRGASDDTRHPAVKPCGATERRGRNGGVPGPPCVFRPPRPVLGYAGWRYSFGHSPRSFSAAVTSNPAAGVIANPGGFGFFLWALRLIAIFCANSITAELPFDSALLIIQSAAQDRALLYPNRSPSKRVRTVRTAAF